MAFRFTQDFDIRNTQPIDVRQVVLDRTATVSNYQSAENFVGGDLSNPANGLETNTTFVGMVVYQTGAANGGSGLYVLTATPHTNESNWHHLSEARSQDSNVIIYTGTAITNAVPAGDIIVDNRTSNPVTYVSLMSVTLGADQDFTMLPSGSVVQIADRDNDTIFNGGTVANATTFEANVSMQGDVSIGDETTDTLTVTAAADFDHNITVDGTAAFNGNVTLGDAAADITTINGELRYNAVTDIPTDNNFLYVDGSDNNAIKEGTIRTASTSNAGVVQVGSGLAIAPDGTLSTVAGSTVTNLFGTYSFPVEAGVAQNFTISYHLTGPISSAFIRWSGFLLSIPSDNETVGDHSISVSLSATDATEIHTNAPNSRPRLTWVENGHSHQLSIGQADADVTYDLGTAASGTNGQIQLVPSTGDTDTVTVIGGQGLMYLQTLMVT